MLLANGLSTFYIKSNPAFKNGPRSLPKDPPDCTILGKWVFDNFILADEFFAKALRSFGTCLLVSYSLWGKFVSSLDEITSVTFFVANFNLLSCEWDNFTVTLLDWVILHWYYMKYFIVMTQFFVRNPEWLLLLFQEQTTFLYFLFNLDFHQTWFWIKLLLFMFYEIGII